jgi:hypothetical protein
LFRFKIFLIISVDATIPRKRHRKKSKSRSDVIAIRVSRHQPVAALAERRARQVHILSSVFFDFFFATFFVLLILSLEASP